MNYSLGKITCQRDLENFARLWVCELPKLPAASGYTITLSMSGNAAINLYAQYDTNGSAAYLTDTNAAAQQFTQYYLNGQLIFDFSKELAPLNSYQSYVLPVFDDGTPEYTHFLFEGAGIRYGPLTLTISQNGNVIIQTSAYIDLHDIKDFYERAIITNIYNGSISNWSSTIQSVQQSASSALVNDTNLIVFVHGINVDYWHWLDDSDTVFKRLYWAGYQGKFATVKWPCLLGLQLLDFNTSELYAYKASGAMKTYLNQLRTRFPNYPLNILAHSQGNAVMGEAIEQGAPFDTYILTQGAMSASAYDVDAPVNPTLTNQEVLHPTPEWQPMGYHGVYTNLTGRMVSFYNTNDFVLEIWTANQFGYKPNELILNGGNYFYDGANSWHIIEGMPPLLVTDPQESRAMVSRSRTWSIGVQQPAQGQTKQGVISSTVELNAQFGFAHTIDEHSAQWTRPIQTSLPYYIQVLNSIKP